MFGKVRMNLFLRNLDKLSYLKLISRRFEVQRDLLYVFLNNRTQNFQKKLPTILNFTVFEFRQDYKHFLLYVYLYFMTFID